MQAERRRKRERESVCVCVSERVKRKKVTDLKNLSF